eukprot:scaffold11003_cov80-Skeletonema_dohrnii-CCMP3373.AAC.2
MAILSGCMRWYCTVQPEELGFLRAHTSVLIPKYVAHTRQECTEYTADFELRGQAFRTFERVVFEFEPLLLSLEASISNEFCSCTFLLRRSLRLGESGRSLPNMEVQYHAANSFQDGDERQSRERRMHFGAVWRQSWGAVKHAWEWDDEEEDGVKDDDEAAEDLDGEGEEDEVKGEGEEL